MATLFGWKFEDPKKEEKEELQTFSTPEADDGASYTATSGVFGTFLPSDSGFHNEFDLIARYRSMVMHPECELAVDEIVNESIVSGRKNSSVSIELDYLEDISEMLKERIRNEFEYLLEKLNFKYNGYEIFRRWFVDGRLYYHVIIDHNNTQKGIVELRTLDPFKIKKIREKKEEEQKIQIGQDELVVNQQYHEYFLYSDTGIDPGKNASTLHDSGNQKNVLKIAPETIAYANSGLLDERRTNVISYLHKAFRALNQVRMLEDASIIYRLSRAPSRRVFYVDVGNLPKAKAEQYMYSLMNQYRNKMVYDSKTGTMKDDRKFQTMLEDYWMPRRNGCFDLSTKISLLDGRNVELGQLIVEHKAGKENWTYSVDEKGHVVPGLISWAGVTRNDAEVLDVHLDNGEIITATPDHKFILRNGQRIEASNLTEGSSLMPFNMKRKAVSPNDRTKEYLQVQHNDTEKYEFVHRAVSEFMNRPQEKTEVIHHIDLNRFNNTPSNLKIMDRNEHIELHSKLGKKNWKVADVKTWRKNLSISGKAFFQTEAGEKRRKEISAFNQTCEAVWKGLELGREIVRQMRADDRKIMTNEEWLNKWYPKRATQAANGSKVAAEKLAWLKENDPEQYQKQCAKHDSGSKQRAFEKYYKSVQLSKIIEIVRQEIAANPRVSNQHLIAAIQKKYSQLSLETVRKFISSHGYNSISELIVRNCDESLIVQKRKEKATVAQNHTVVKIVRRTDRMDVGTLTIDGDHQYHDYHNFALSSGIFVMNSATTEIDTIQGSEANFTQLDELEYFQRQLFRSLNVPISRMQPESGFSLGRASEISREEYKFLRFIERLRNRFSMLFIELLKKQLVLKNIMSLKQWEDIKSKIHFVYDQDSNFNSLKNLELLSEKMNVLREAEEYRGKYFSANYIRKEILSQTDEDIERIDEEIEEERYDSKFGMQQGEEGMGDMGGGMGGGFGGGGDTFGDLGPEPAGGAPLGATPEEGGMENDLAPEPTDTTINPGV